MNQTQEILDYILNKGSITTKQATEEIGCYRLSARIYEIRALGIDVQKEMIRVLNRKGETCRVARYTIPNPPSIFYSVTA